MLCFLENGVRSKNDANRYPRPARAAVFELARDNWQTLVVVIVSAALIVLAYH